jgi:hypothetical protein
MGRGAEVRQHIGPLTLQDYGLMHRSKQRRYSIASSARSRIQSGKVIPSVLLEIDIELDLGSLLDWQVG